MTTYTDYSGSLTVAAIERYWNNREEKVVAGNKCAVRGHGHYRIESSRRCIRCAYDKDETLRRAAKRAGRFYIGDRMYLTPQDREALAKYIRDPSKDFGKMFYTDKDFKAESDLAELLG